MRFLKTSLTGLSCHHIYHWLAMPGNLRCRLTLTPFVCTSEENRPATPHAVTRES